MKKKRNNLDYENKGHKGNMKVIIPITKNGKVWSNRYEKWLKEIKHSHGYSVVHLCVNREDKKKKDSSSCC